MRKNYFLSSLVVFFCVALYPQSPQETYQDSTKKLAKAANKALDNYDYNQSIEMALRLINLAEEKEDYDQLNHGYNVLGITYEVLEDSVRAKENYLKALEYAHQSGNDTLVWYAYNNLANIYSSNEETVQKGLDFYKKAIEIASRLPGNKAFTPVLNIGWTYLENGQYERALPYLNQAKELFTEKNNKTFESDLYSLYGMYFSGVGQFEKAEENFQKSIAIAEKDSLIVEAAFAYEEFSKMLFNSGDYKEAFSALKKHQEYREEIFEEEKNLQREAVYGRFETEEYKKDLAVAKREQQYKDEVIAKSQQITTIMVIFLIVMAIFLLLFYRSNRVRKKLISQLRDKNNELISAKEEAERLSLLKTRFFSTVSHELRTPLYGVVGLATLLLEDNKNDKQREDLESLKFSADYLLALINDVLQMNKMESNLVHLENSNFDLKELFSGIVKSFETTHKHNSNTMELVVDPEIPNDLIGDPMRLSQVVMNLLGNAVKFTEGGKVWLKAEKRNCGPNSCLIYFEVGDTGAGIPADKQEEIFEEFSQLKTHNFNYQGTGLGLTIVKKLLTLFDSEIHLESEEGKGSVFSFQIAFEQGEKASSVANLTGISEAQEDSLIRKILIVDDNRINQVVTRRILEKKDFLCFVAASGEEAISILQKEPFDLVLMDVNMPGMNGMETTREIRKFNSGIPVIALTAVEVGEMKDEILEAGMTDIINKPYDLPQFFRTIQKNFLEPVA